MIFNLFKAKPTLKDLIPEGYIDIHSHILPGIDDGAKNFEESLLLISKMKELGFSKIIATPHTYPGIYNNTNLSIEKSFNKIKSGLKKEKIIKYASEYLIDYSILEKIEKKDILCLNKNYVLIEMSYMAPPRDLTELIWKFRINDYIPVIAHPERYPYYFNNKRIFFKLRDMGCNFQFNLLSITGYYGQEVIKKLDWFLSNEIIDFAGSDIHSIKHIDQFNNKIKTNKIDSIKRVLDNNLIYFDF